MRLQRNTKSTSPTLPAKPSSPILSNRLFAGASSNCSRVIAPRSTCPSKCPPSKASSASCKWAWAWPSSRACRSEEHTSELQSLTNLLCRLLLEQKNNKRIKEHIPQDDHK